MESDYIQNRVHDILVGRIAMGAGRKKKAGVVGKKKKSKNLRIADFTKNDIKKYSEMNASERKNYIAKLRKEGYKISPGVITALGKRASGGVVIGGIKKRRVIKRKIKAGARAGKSVRRKRVATKRKRNPRSLNGEGASAGARQKKAIVNAGYKKALQDCLKALSLLKKAK